MMHIDLPVATASDAAGLSALLYSLGGIIVFSAVRMLSRGPLVRTLCSVGRVACALYPVVLAASWWLGNDPFGRLVGNTTSAVSAVRLPFDLPQLPLGLEVRPPTDLEAGALAWAIGLVVFFLVALRSQRSSG